MLGQPFGAKAYNSITNLRKRLTDRRQVLAMYSQYVTRAGARMLVAKAIKEGARTETQLTDQLINTEDTAAIARQLVDAAFRRLEHLRVRRDTYERCLIDELAKRDTRESAEIFAAEIERTWIQQHEQGYPASNLDPEERPRPHGTAGHTCWQQIEDRHAYIGGWDSQLPHILIQVASYLGAAGVGGVISNRADALFTATARYLFRRVDERWHRHARTPTDRLTKEEAVDAARASAMVRGYLWWEWVLKVQSTTQNTDHSWTVILNASCQANECRENLSINVPTGDPCNATIFLIDSATASRCPHTRYPDDKYHVRWLRDD
jgi:hypothetical protein